MPEKRSQDITQEEVEEACQAFLSRGRRYVKAKQIADHLGTSTSVVAASIGKDVHDWPLEDSGFGQSGTTWRITLDDD
jgi:hypothetical protein